MQALGNDFVFFPDRDHKLLPQLNRSLIRQLCDRHYGIGCDQMLVIQPTATNNIVHYHIFNANGNKVGQCGNGARCVAWWAHLQGWCDTHIQLQTSTTMMQGQIIADNWVTINLPKANWQANSIPLNPDYLNHCQGDDLNGYSIQTDRLTWHCVNIGNPHAVACCTTDIEALPLQSLASKLKQQAVFLEGINVSIMHINYPHDISLRVHERDAGETSGCGSGACAAAEVGWRYYGLDSPLNVHLKGGLLTIDDKHPHHLQMTGPAYLSFYGQINL